MYDLTSLLPIQNQFCVLIGNSGSGKSTFIKNLCDHISLNISIYYFNKNSNSTDFALTTRPVIALQNLSFEETWINSHIKCDSILIFDDFYLEKSAVNDFRRVVNYHCRHKRLTLFIIIHSIFKNNIFNEISLSSHLFLLKSNSGRQVATRKKVLQAYNTLISSNNIKQLLYINHIQEYCLSLESDIVKHKISPIEMFLPNGPIYTIHIKNSQCPDLKLPEIQENDDENEIFTHYSPRNKRKIFFILSCFKKNNIFKDNLVSLDKNVSMHIFDVLALFLNPFSKKELSKQEILFMKKLKASTHLYPLPKHIIPAHLRKYI